MSDHGGRLASVRQDVAAIPEPRDFSVCLNAFGPAPIVRTAIRDAAIDSYPDRYSRTPRQAVAYRWDRPMEEIVFGAGAAELIQAVCFAYLSRGDSVVIGQPAFGEYERASRLCGAQVHHVFTTLSHDDSALRDSATELVSALFRVRPRLLFMASPASPSGVQMPIPLLEHIASTCARLDCLLVLDQSYDSFSSQPHGTPALPGHTHVIHIRSLTKDHALAGVRAAFAITAPQIVQHIERGRVPWASSTAAQAAAVAAMSNEAMQHVSEATQLLREEAARIAEFCTSVDVIVEPSSTHYMLVRCANATCTREKLLEQHAVLVRDCTSFGLPNHIRVAARKPAENAVLMNALESLSSKHTT